MRRLQKVMTGVFLGGVLLGGVGTGLAVVEYSTLSYGGERLVGEEYMVTKNLDFEFPQDGRMLVLVNNYYLRHGNTRLETDASVPVGLVRYEITYNEKRVVPELIFEPCEEEMPQEPDEESGAEEPGEPEGESVPEGESQGPEEGSVLDGESSGPEGESLPEDEQRAAEGESLPEDEQRAAEGESLPEGEQQEPEKESIPREELREPVRLGYLELNVWDRSNPFEVFMENKDYFLEELKQRKISSYREAYITAVTVKVNPETRPYVEVGNGWR